MLLSRVYRVEVLLPCTPCVGATRKDIAGGWGTALVEQRGQGAIVMLLSKVCRVVCVCVCVCVCVLKVHSTT
jgi:hypothetical protein